MTSEGIEPRAIGAIIHGRYRVIRIVGRGGLGTVYQVSDIVYGANAIFALKELADTNPGARKQFELEARWLRELNHDSIPKVRESFEWDGRVYLVMDFVDGENLEQYLHRTGRPLPEAQALRWMLPICDALHYLHTRTPPLLHRDVKPANIIVTPGGHPVLVDFGIAKAHLPGMNQTVTFVRKAGTEGYAPPEQYAATGMTGPWSDVYALGATIYQLITGRVPPTAVERITETSPMAGPRDLVPTISPLTNQAILRALDLKPAARFQTVIEFASALTDSLRVLGGLGGVGAAIPVPAMEAVAPPDGRATGQVGFAPQTPLGQPSRAPLPSLGEPLPNNLVTPAGPAYPNPAGILGGFAARSPMPAPMPSPLPISSPPAPMGAPPISGPRQAVRPPSAPSLKPPVPPAPQSRARTPVIIGLVVVLLAVLAGGAFYAYHAFGAPDRSTPRATVSGYFQALQNQDYNTAWTYDADSRNNPNARAEFIQGLQSDDANYGVVRSAAIDQVAMTTDSQATVTVSAQRGSASTPMSYTVGLNEYDGSIWLIVSIDTQ
ncbi:MAG TPA: protein kinase [Ktedonobacterales bacterium]